MTTIKQKLVAKEITENNRTSISKAMRKSGYAPSTATKPSNLTKSKGWNELMEKYLPDNELLETHKRALKAQKQIGALILIDKDGKVISKENEGMIEVDDTTNQLKAVELGYKVKKKLGPETLQQFNLGGEMSIKFIEDDK
jgi:hypothetical protein